MAIITLTSDFGESDHYVGTLKGSILSTNPSQVIVDISHQIQSFDLAHGAFVIRSSFPAFPKGSIHLVAVDTAGHHGNTQLAVQLDDHFFLMADHGLLGLISEQEPEMVVALPAPETNPSAFPALEILVPAAIELAQGADLKELGTQKTDYLKMVGRQMRVNKTEIIGHVVRVDHYGNLITNISKEAFDQLSSKHEYTILIGREKFRRINNTINETGSGDCYVMFNSMGLLEVGINKGNASALMGLGFDSPVRISFGLSQN